MAHCDTSSSRSNSVSVLASIDNSHVSDILISSDKSQTKTYILCVGLIITIKQLFPDLNLDINNYKR